MPGAERDDSGKTRPISVDDASGGDKSASRPISLNLLTTDAEKKLNKAVDNIGALLDTQGLYTLRSHMDRTRQEIAASYPAYIKGQAFPSETVQIEPNIPRFPYPNIDYLTVTDYKPPDAKDHSQFHFFGRRKHHVHPQLQTILDSYSAWNQFDFFVNMPTKDMANTYIDVLLLVPDKLGMQILTQTAENPMFPDRLARKLFPEVFNIKRISLPQEENKKQEAREVRRKTQATFWRQSAHLLIVSDLRNGKVAHQSHKYPKEIES